MRIICVAEPSRPLTQVIAEEILHPLSDASSKTPIDRNVVEKFSSVVCGAGVYTPPRPLPTHAPYSKPSIGPSVQTLLSTPGFAFPKSPCHERRQKQQEGSVDRFETYVANHSNHAQLNTSDDCGWAEVITLIERVGSTLPKQFKRGETGRASLDVAFFLHNNRWSASLLVSSEMVTTIGRYGFDLKDIGLSGGNLTVAFHRGWVKTSGERPRRKLLLRPRAVLAVPQPQPREHPSATEFEAKLRGTTTIGPAVRPEPSPWAMAERASAPRRRCPDSPLRQREAEP